MIDDAEIVVIAYGTTARIAKGAIKRVRKDGVRAGHDPAHHPLALPEEGA